MCCMSTFSVLDLTKYFEQVSPDSIRIKGHRIGIEHVLKYYLEGYTPEEIAQEFPGLDLEKIYATITLFLAHKEEIESYLQRRRERDLEEYEKWSKTPSPSIQRLRIIREEHSKFK
jgi:uncharacterized protein (DUF433 family)